MHYNPKEKREEILEQYPDAFRFADSKVETFINLCIYPYKFDNVFRSLRDFDKISMPNYNATKGVINGLIVLTKRHNFETIRSIDEYLIDFIKVTRAYNKDNSQKFLLSMRWYMSRFMFIVGLKVAFGVDWRDFVFEVLNLNHKPQPKTVDSLFSSKYLRGMLHAYIIWKTYKESFDPEYEEGKNDLRTLIGKYTSLKTGMPVDTMVKLVDGFHVTLPSYSYSVRRKSAWAIDTAQDGYNIIHNQLNHGYTKDRNNGNAPENKPSI